MIERERRSTNTWCVVSLKQRKRVFWIVLDEIHPVGTIDRDRQRERKR